MLQTTALTIWSSITSESGEQMNTLLASGWIFGALVVGVVLGIALTANPRRAKKRKVSNVVLLALAIFLFAFIVCMIVTFWVKGSVPDTLIQCTLGAGGVEAVVLAAIKISKTMKGENDNGKSDSETE